MSVAVEGPEETLHYSKHHCQQEVDIEGKGGDVESGNVLDEAQGLAEPEGPEVGHDYLIKTEQPGNGK